MSNSIMHDLYFGNVTPWERGRPKGPDYTSAGRKAGDLIKHFLDTLPEEQRRQFEEIQGAQTKYRLFEELDLFEYAFSMGALTMIEVFNFKQGRTEEQK